MSKFEDVVKQDTPRLVVKYGKDTNNNDQFQWGIVGAIPILRLLGAIIRVQSIITIKEWMPTCPEVALVIAWDANACKLGDFDIYLHPDIPSDALLGMLEAIKSTILQTHMARQVAAQQVHILGIDGRPIM